MNEDIKEIEEAGTVAASQEDTEALKHGFPFIDTIGTGPRYHPKYSWGHKISPKRLWILLQWQK